jgi:hypothetical protein
MFSLKINTYITQDLCEYGVSTAFVHAIMSQDSCPFHWPRSEMVRNIVMNKIPTSSMRCPKMHCRGPVGWMGFFWQEWMRWGAGRSITKYSQPHELEVIKVISGCEKKWFGTFQFRHVTTFHDCPSFPRSSIQNFTLLTTVSVDEEARPQNILI